MALPTTRREARERALELLYEADAKSMAPTDVIAALPIRPDEYAVELVTGVQHHRAALDEAIARHSRSWRLDRMPAVDRTVLRLATYELAHQPAVPVAVVIDEAVELAKRYSTDDSGRFVNGILGPIAAELRGGDGGAPPA